MYIHEYVPPKNSEKRSALSVADVTITFKSRLVAATFFNMPKRTSVCKDLTVCGAVAVEVVVAV